MQRISIEREEVLQTELNLEIISLPSERKTNSNAHQVPKKNSRPCANWAYGKCTFGDKCRFEHPIRRPDLAEVLEYQESHSTPPDTMDGIQFQTPDLPGLPNLVANGMCRVMGDYVIYFIPFYIPFEGKYFYKKLVLFRLNKRENRYKQVFSHRMENFHFTTAAATNGFFVCSRLPYDANVLKLMCQAKKLDKEKKKVQQAQARSQEKITRLQTRNETLQNRVDQQSTQLSRAYANNRQQQQYFTNKISQVRSQNTSLQRHNQSLRRDNTAKRQQLQSAIFANFRRMDPVDVFVFHPKQKTMAHVVEYHKPADHVHLQKNILTLYDEPSGRSHSFKIVLHSGSIASYDVTEPLRPSALCSEF